MKKPGVFRKPGHLIAFLFIGFITWVVIISVAWLLVAWWT